MKSIRLFLFSLLALVALQVDAHAVQLCNKAWVNIDSTGTTDPITLGSAVSGNQTLADCGITDGQVVPYSIFDGANWEVGTGTYTASGTTLTRNVLESSNSDTEISLSATATLVVAPLKQDMTSETTPTEASPTASDFIFILQSGVLERSQVSAFETALEGFLDAADLQGDIALTTDTSGNYVQSVADGTGIDGTAAGEGATYTPTFDATEISSATWGAGSFTSFVFDAGATDPTFTFGSGQFVITNADIFIWTSVDAGAGSNPILTIDRDSGSPAAGDNLGGWSFRGNDDGLNNTDYAQMRGELDDPTNTSEDGSLIVNLMTAGTLASEYVFTGAAFIPFANDGAALGNATNQFSDVFVASGAVINAGGGEVTLTFAADLLTIAGALQVDLDDEAELRLYEEDAGGTNYKGFKSPAAVTANTTCTFEDDANFIPDSCVGDGSDDDTPESGDFGNLTGGTGITNSAGTLSVDLTEITSGTFGSNNATSFTYSTDGVDITLDFSTTDGVLTITGGGSSPVLAVDDQGALRLYEEDGGGSNFLAFAAPAAITSDATCTLENDANFIPDTCVGDGSDDDVPESGDFTNLTGGSGIDNNSGTLDFDATEISSATWGAGSFTTFTFDAGATDPTLTFGSATLTIEAITSLRQADASNAGGTLRLLEDPGTGANFIALLAPAAITSDVTCTLENDANPIPDSCVGDGTDDVGGGGLTDPATLSSTDAGATAGPTFNYDRDSASPAANDDLGITVFLGNDDAAANQTYADIRARIISAAAAGPDGALIFRTVNNDALLEALRLDDFNVAITGGAESNSHGQFSGATRRPRLQAIDDSIDGGSIGLETFSATDGDSSYIILAKIGGATVGTFSAVVNAEQLGCVRFEGADGTDLETGAQICSFVDAEPVTAGDTTDMPSRMVFYVTPDGSATPGEVLRFDNTKAWGLNGANFGSSGQAIINNGAASPSWQTIIGKKALWVGAGSLIPNFTNGCVPVDIETATNDVMFRSCSYDATTQESAQYQIRMPDTWNEGTVTFVPVWSHPSTATNFGVVFDLACLATSNDDTLEAAFGTEQTSTDTGGTTDDVYLGPESSAITCAGSPAAGDYVTFRVRRVPANGSDTLAVDARLHGFTLYYTETSFVEP